jgi:hypothetical protein
VQKKDEPLCVITYCDKQIIGSGFSWQKFNEQCRLVDAPGVTTKIGSADAFFTRAKIFAKQNSIAYIAMAQTFPLTLAAPATLCFEGRRSTCHSLQRI